MSALERDLVAFAQRLVATPSLPGEERDAAELVATKLVDLGYRDVTIDPLSNVVGYLGPGTPRHPMMAKTRSFARCRSWPRSSVRAGACARTPSLARRA